jgi:hypothetical protein
MIAAGSATTRGHRWVAGAHFGRKLGMKSGKRGTVPALSAAGTSSQKAALAGAGSIEDGILISDCPFPMTTPAGDARVDK